MPAVWMLYFGMHWSSWLLATVAQAWCSAGDLPLRHGSSWREAGLDPAGTATVVDLDVNGRARVIASA